MRDRQSFLATANILIGLLFALAVFDMLPVWQSTGWCGLVIVVQSLRLYVFWTKASAAIAAKRFWWRVHVFSALSGSSWGLIALMTPTEAPLTFLAMHVFFAAGMTAAAAVTLSVSFTTYLIFLFTTVGPFIALNIFADDQVYHFTALAVVGFLAGMIYASSQVHRLIVESLKLAHTNQALMDDLQSARQALEVRVSQRESEIDSLLGIVPAFVWIAHDRQGRSISVSDYARRKLTPVADAAGSNQAVAEAAYGNALHQAIEGQPVENMEVNCQLIDGNQANLIVNAIPLYDQAQQINGAVAVGLDITRHKAAERALSISQARFRDFANSASDWLWETDAEHRIVWVSPNVEARAGGLANALKGRTRVELNDGNDPELMAAHLVCLEARKPFRDFEYRRQLLGQNRWVRVSGVPIFGDDHRFVGYRGVANDVTERRLAQNMAEHLAMHDSLTGLTNRHGFHHELQQACAQDSVECENFGVLMIDVDRFKYINDTHGHLTGDAFLKSLGQRIAQTVGDDGRVARIGGDEFAVLLSGLSDQVTIAAVAERLIKAMDVSIRADQTQIFPSISIGGASFGGDARHSDDLMRLADRALYRAKQDGRNRYCLYDRQLDQMLEENSRFTRQLATALKREQFELHYQPQIDLQTGAIVGAEALLRWRHPEHGLVMPDRFIKLAESGGLMNGIGHWVIRHACEQTARWRAKGASLSVSINLAHSQITDLGTVGKIIDLLSANRLTQADLEFEITETVIMESVSLGRIDSLKPFAEQSLRIALDDFGTGHSSLAYLLRLPAQTIKIDRSFVSNIGTDPDSDAIVTAIIGLGRTLGKTVLAEGVETTAQRDFLRNAGCDRAQGYLFSRPIPSDEIDTAMMYAA